MNKILIFLGVLLTMAGGARGGSLTLSGDTTEIKSWGKYNEAPSSIVSSIKAGDVLSVTVTAKDPTVQWPQLNIQSKADTTFAQANQYGIVVFKNAKIYNEDSFPVTVEYTFTDADLPVLQKNNSLYLSGTGVTVTDMILTQAENGTTQTISLWTGETVCADDWSSGYVVLPASKFSDAAAGDRLQISVSAISGTCANPVIALQNGSWQNFSGVDFFPLKGETAPVAPVFTLSSDMLSQIKGETDGVNSGLVVKGCGYTLTGIDLVKRISSGNIEDKGQPLTNLWTGNEQISWTTGENNSVVVAAEKFASATAGMKLRMSFTGLKIGAQGRILHGWAAYQDANTYEKLPSKWGNYYEFNITETMLADLKGDGLRVSGVGYTLTSVDLVDPDKEYNVVAEADRNDIKAWEPGETPKITVTLTNRESAGVTVTVDVQLMTDMYTDYRSYSQEVSIGAGETKNVDTPLELEPGFYRMVVNANHNNVCTYTIGYDPTAIGCKDDSQPDFRTYWDAGKAGLAEIAPEFTIEEEMADYSTANRKVYRVSMKSYPDYAGGSPVTIRGYYAEPVAAGTYPAIVRFQGTDNGTATPPCIGGDDLPGWCELIISTRGQMLNRVAGDNIYGTDFYGYGFGDLDRHYYRGAYLDCVRAIDFIASREKVDSDNIFAAGGSQGGCFTYVAAGLDNRLKAIAPSITGHADFRHTMETVAWPTNIFKAKQQELGWTDEQLFSFLSYFDTMNFSSRITCPVITNFSLQDQTDGPHLNIAPYNLLVNVPAEDKAYSVNAFLGHSTPATWPATYMAFFQNYLPKTVDNSYTLSVPEAGWSTLYLGFDAIVPENVEVCTVKAITEETVVLTPFRHETGRRTVIPKVTPVAVKATEGSYTFSESTAIQAGDLRIGGTNLLKGVLHDTPSATLGTISALARIGGTTGFYPVENSVIFPANKAYLPQATQGAKPYSLRFDGTSTGIATAILPTSGNVKYTLGGLRTNSPESGLYIINGRKIIVK